MIKGNRIIELVFTIFSLTLALQFNLEINITNFVIFIGAEKESIIHEPIKGILLAAIFTIIGLMVIFIYENFVWRLWPWSGCKEGWWLYTLVDPQGIEVAGYFYIHHTPSVMKITAGKAFDIEKDKLKWRGNWNSNEVWLTENSFSFIFEMNTQSPKEDTATVYFGYLKLTKFPGRPDVGTTTWYGNFQDFGDRKNFHGQVYAEKLTIKIKKIDDVRDKLGNGAKLLRSKLNEEIELA